MRGKRFKKWRRKSNKDWERRELGKEEKVLYEKGINERDKEMGEKKQRGKEKWGWGEDRR